MQIVLVILVVALIAKDISLVGDPYFLRGAAQVLCLLTGTMWLATQFSVDLLKRYWSIVGYLLALLLGIYGTRDPIYVTLQIVSLAAMVIFAVAYFESRNQLPAARRTNTALVQTTAFMYSVIAWLSLAAAVYLPAVAYLDVNAGNIAGIQVRFRGLFSQAGMMGAASGLLVMLALFGVRHWLPKLMLAIPGAICLGLTSSRTFWVGALVAAALTRWSYYRRGRIWIFAAAAAGAFAFATATAFDIHFDTKAIGKLARVESINTFSGRVQLWERALKSIEVHPYLGYGFTEGAASLEEEEVSRSIGESPKTASRELGRRTLHNGYVQSLLDSGAIGTAFYLLVIALSIHGFYKHDKERAFPAEFAGLIFLAVANLGEAVIYSASVFSSVAFWFLAVFALSLEGAKRSSLSIQKRAARSGRKSAALSAAGGK